MVVLDVREMAWVRRGDVGRAICAHTAVPWLISSPSGSGDENNNNSTSVAGAALVFGGFTGAALHGGALHVDSP